MQRPVRFQDYKYLGDKRTQIAYDIDEVQDESVILELLESEQFLSFAPDTPAEVRNRGYRIRSV